MNNSVNDNRREPRVFREDSLSLKLINPGRAGAEQSASFYCSTVDISASGMQIYVTDPLPIAQLVEIWVVLADNLGTYNLIGKVSRIIELDDPDEPDGFLAGLELQYNSPDIRAWRDLF